MSHVKDYFTSDRIYRMDGNHRYDIVNNKVVTKTLPIRLKSIAFYKLYPKSNFFNLEDRRIGVIDLETYMDNNQARVYAAGLYTYKDEKPHIWYIDKNTLDSDQIIFDLIYKMFHCSVFSCF